jgi:hypothetical protein
MDVCDTSGRTSAGYQNGIDCLGFAEWKLKCLSKSVEKDRDAANRHPSPPGSCSDELRTLSMCWSLGGPLEGQPHHREVDPSVGSFQVSATEYRLPTWGPCTSSGVPCRASCVLPCTATTPQPPVSCWELQRHPIANLPSTQSQRHPTTTVVVDPNVPNPILATNTLRASYLNSSDIYSALPTQFQDRFEHRQAPIPNHNHIPLRARLLSRIL